MTREEILASMEEAVRLGANQLFLQGGVNREIPFDYYVDVISAVRRHFGPELHIRAFSPVELMHMEESTGLSLEEVLRTLKEAGLDSVPGAGAEILTERMRKKLSPRKATVEEWSRVMETCHREGLPGSANVVFGSEETREEVVEHLRVIREIQDRTGGFLAFVVWTFQQQTDLFKVRAVPPHEYLKVLGIARIFLDNIPHLETSLMVLGPVLGSLALHAGADDISSVVLEEKVLTNNSFTREEDAVRFLRESGFQPRKRDFLYRYSAAGEASTAKVRR